MLLDERALSARGRLCGPPGRSAPTREGSAGTAMAASLWRILIALAALMLLAAAVPAHAEEEFLPPDEAFVLSVSTTAPDELAVYFRVAPKYYMYRERFSFVTSPQEAGAALGTPQFPQGIVKYDPTFEQDLEVYYDHVLIKIPLQSGVTDPFKLAITSQGCADAGLCYPPMTQEISLTPTEAGYAAEGRSVVAKLPASATANASGGTAVVTGATNSGNLAGALRMGDTGFADYLGSAGWIQVILLCLVLGLLLSFTPCVLPMVPILLAILAGGSAQAKAVSRWKGLALAAVFVLGMSLVYTALGIAAALLGASLAIWLQSPWVLALFAVLLSLFALAMFDVFTLQLPSGMQSALNRRLTAIPGGRYGGVFLMGMMSALIVGPCIAAPLAGVLLFISQTGDLVLGGTALFALAWGEGLLLLAVGASSGLLMPKAGPWMNSIKYLFGVLLLATAWWMVNSILPVWLYLLGWALLGLWAAALLGVFNGQSNQAGPGRLLLRAIGAILALWAIMLLAGLAAGGRDLFRPLAPFTGAAGSSMANSTAPHPAFAPVQSGEDLDRLIAQSDKPVMLDFYADWCVSCIQMEKFTFSDPTVAALMAQFTLVQADVTENSLQHRDLLRRFRLFGPPGIIFFDAKGGELSDVRVVGFKNATEFSAVLTRVLNR